MRTRGDTAGQDKAAAAFGLRIIARAAPESFSLWRGNLRAAQFFTSLPGGIRNYIIPPAGGKMIFTGLDWTAVCALLSARYPLLTARKRRQVLDGLRTLENALYGE